MCWVAAWLALPRSPRRCALQSEHSPGGSSGTKGPPARADNGAVLSPGAQGRWFSPGQGAEEPDLFNISAGDRSIFWESPRKMHFVPSLFGLLLASPTGYWQR